MDKLKADQKFAAPPPNVVIARFLEDNVPEYCRLVELRQRGWANPRGDTFFATQRQNADQANAKVERYFYTMMQRIAKEMNLETHALQLDGNSSKPPRILDFCAAPGGFISEIMQLNPDARARVFSLPAFKGGHRMLMPKNPRMSVSFLDVTMLAGDMGIKEIPTGHPDSENFVSQRLQAAWEFDLIICDGQVLRSHNRADYREQCEARRLTAVQLALGLQHVRKGGTMIILLHKLDAWDTVATIFRFSRFSSVRLFKPQRSHAKRSSFYLIATDISSGHADALTAINIWREVWKSATFPSGDYDATGSITDGLDVNQVLSEFGSLLIELGQRIWSIQADALAQAPFTAPVTNIRAS